MISIDAQVPDSTTYITFGSIAINEPPPVRTSRMLAVVAFPLIS